MGISFNSIKSLFQPAPGAVGSAFNAAPGPARAGAATGPVASGAASSSALYAYSSSSLNLTGGSTAPAAFPPGTDEATMRQAFVGIFSEGVSRDYASQPQLQSLNGYLNGLGATHLQTLGTLMSWARSRTEQIFTLKALVAGEPWQNVVQYANEMRGMPEAEIVRRSTMRDNRELIQQWQDSCGPTLLQVAAGEADPRFAWELNKAADLSKVDPYGASQLVASQQKQWLEAYGGVAVERGGTSGQGIALNQMLNDMLTPLTRATYSTMEVDNPGQAFDTVAQKVAAGLDVPLRFSWAPAGSGSDPGHFVLAMAVRGTPGSRELQIHDPWSGQTGWVSEAGLQQNQAAPLFNGFARMSHYYDPQPLA